MANGNCNDESSNGAGVEPVNPFTALAPHFGMLLGVEDLEVLQGYARGKMRIHNSWLHRAGVVWGLDVLFEARSDGTVLKVTPGLGIDGAGRELYLPVPVCVDVGQWYVKHQGDDGFVTTDAGGGGKRFNLSVVACFRACLDRPVPAIVSPCEGTGVDTAFSRLAETAELTLRPLPPGTPPPPAPPPYRRLRVLFRIADDESAFPDVVAIRDGIQALPAADQPRAYLAAFRRLAALDAIDLSPQQIEGRRSLYPEDPGCLVLATIVDVVVTPAGEGRFTLVTPPPVPEVKVRKVHVATSTIQELLCGPAAAPGTDGESTTPTPTDAGGPRIDPGTVTVTSKRITFTASAALADASVETDAFSVTAFDEDGWVDVDIHRVGFDAATLKVTIDLKEALEPGLLRVIARGTGPMPLLGTNRVPLAGAVGGPPGGASDGRDFVFMTERS